MAKKAGTAWARLGLVVSLAGLAGLALAGLGTRWGLWGFRTGFLVFRGAALAGLAGAVLSLAGLLRGRRSALGLAILGVAIGLGAAWVPWGWYRLVKRLPMIHDITTDTETPPPFAAVLPLRKGAPNPADYGGPEVAAQQQKAYPHLKPAVLPVPPDQAFGKALAAARALGWEIVAADAAQGRIEATDTTFWFGFKDDIVVRIAPANGGSRVDVRSVSRVGRSDIGTNARRVGAYLERLQKKG